MSCMVVAVEHPKWQALKCVVPDAVQTGAKVESSQEQDRLQGAMKYISDLLKKTIKQQ